MLLLVQRICLSFQGSSTINTSVPNENITKYKWGHLAMTYTAIATLVTLGDDLKRLNRKAIIKGWNCKNT